MGKIRPIMVKGHERPLTQVKYNREGDLLFTSAKDHVPCLWYSDNGERIGTYQGHNGTVWCLDVNCAPTQLDAPRHALASSCYPRLRCVSLSWPPAATTRSLRVALTVVSPPHCCCATQLTPQVSYSCASMSAVKSDKLLTGSADNMCKLWEVETGECLHTWKHTVRLLPVPSVIVSSLAVGGLLPPPPCARLVCLTPYNATILLLAPTSSGPTLSRPQNPLAPPTLITLVPSIPRGLSVMLASPWAINPF